MGAVSPHPIILKSQSPGSSASSDTDKPSPITKLSISKNYVIPPRPKPGRKPSNDIPPSRRKAQNRDAQRAFRERKSQAVRALEEQLAKQAQEFERQQSLMREQIMMLQKQNGKLHAPSSPLSPDFRNGVTLQSIQPHSSPASSPLSLSHHQPTVPVLSPAHYQPIIPSQSPQHLLPSQSNNQNATTPQSPGTPFGTPVTPADLAGLELLDHVLEQKLPVTPQASVPNNKISRRASRSGHSPNSPQSPGAIAVRRGDPPMSSNPLDLINTDWSQPAVPLRRPSKALEMDFTLAYTPRSPRRLSLPSPPAMKDRCGFCTENTPCICAASAAREEGAAMAPDLATLGSPLGPVDGSISQATSPIERYDYRRRLSSVMQIDTPKSPAATDGTDQEEAECTGNPGDCNSCRQDPMLTLFCSAIASKAPAVRIPPLGTFIPAQAAYKTLSRHPRFSRSDLGEVVDILLVKSSQVEVNSVAKVLRMLDTK